MLPHAPGVQVQAIPEDAVREESDDDDKANPDERLTQAALDKRIVPDNEFSDSEDEGEGGRRNDRSFKGRKRPRLDTKTPGEGNEEKLKSEGDGAKPEGKTEEKDEKVVSSDDAKKDAAPNP